MLDGKIYRCPYAANATKLKAIPHKESDRVNLDINESQTSKEEMIKFLTQANLYWHVRGVLEEIILHKR